MHVTIIAQEQHKKYGGVAMAAKRTNLTLSDEIIKYYDELAFSMGIPRNAVFVMALKTYMDQQKSLEMGNIYKAMEELVGKLDEIQQQSNS